MKCFSTLFLLFVGLTLNAQSSEIEDDVFHYIKDNKTSKAFKLIDSYMEKYPDNDSLNLLKGRVYYYSGDGQNAFKFLSKAIDLNENFLPAYVERGNLYLDLHLFEESKLDFEYAATLAKDDSTTAEVKKGLAAYYLYTRDFQQSVNLLEEVLDVFPEDLASLNNIAIALEDLDRRPEAIEYLKRVVEIDSDFIPAYINLGFQLSHVGSYEEALVYFDKAATIDAEEPLLLSNRGFVYYKMKEYKKALVDLNLSIKLFSSNSYAYKNRAITYLAMGENEKACEDLYSALGYGFTKVYGSEVQELIDVNCIK